MKAICVLVLAFVSVFGKVLIKDQDISDAISSNILNVDIKLPIHDIAIIKNVAPKEDLPTTTEKAIKTSDNTLDDYDNIVVDVKGMSPSSEGDDNGTALLLTPYIEEGRLEEAREASKVDADLFLGIESFSGYLTVNKTYNSNIFFWYFPVLKPANDTPWIIWLQGGPGASSMTGLFDELGPFHADMDGNLKANPYTWLQNHSLVFIDSPVGTGYSFTDHKDGYATDMATYGKHLHTAVKQLVQIFPELRLAPLFVAGESYGGKYVPALGMEIHRHRNVPGGDINLKGLMIGNAYVEPAMITQMVRPFFNFGLIEKEQIDYIKPLMDAFLDDVANNRSIQAKEKWNSLIFAFLILSQQRHGYNFLRDELSVGHYLKFLSKSEVKRAIHVGDIDFRFINITVNVKLAGDFLSTSKPLFEELLNHYKVLAYCGHLDQMLPCAASSDTYRTWTWDHSEDFIKAPRRPYVLNRSVAGYIKTGGGLTWVVIRGAGHMAAMDAPQAVQILATQWTHNQPLPMLPERSINFAIVLNNTLAYLPSL